MPRNGSIPAPSATAADEGVPVPAESAVWEVGAAPAPELAAAADDGAGDQFRIECATELADFGAALLDLQQGATEEAVQALSSTLGRFADGATAAGFILFGDVASAMQSAILLLLTQPNIDTSAFCEPLLDGTDLLGRLIEEEPNVAADAFALFTALVGRLENPPTTESESEARAKEAEAKAQAAAAPLTPKERALLKKFVITSDERIGAISRSLCELEQSFDDASANEMMREIHTLKGECRVMGFGSESDTAHTIEDELLRARKLNFKIEPTELDTILKGLAGLNQSLSVAGMRALTIPPPPSPDGAAAGTPAGGAQKRRADAFVRVANEQLKELTDVTGDLVLQHQKKERSVADISRLTRDSLGIIERLTGGAQAAAGQPGAVPELVESLRTVSAYCREMLTTVSKIQEESFHFGFRLTKLQDAIRHLRLLRLGTVFEQYPLAVREMARDLGKEVNVVLEGGEVSVDKTVLDRLDDVLLHLLRNSVDHGLEDPETRRRSGKDSRGTIWLSAKQQNSRVEISVRDDGRGIDPERVRSIAVKKGIIDEATAAKLTRDEALLLIFRPGFSTREQASDMSGRGVGTDVVKERIEGLGGTVRLTTDVGRGSTFSLIIPISIALTDVIVVQSTGGLYGLATGAVESILRAVPSERVAAGSGFALRIQSELVPIVGLHSLIGGAGPQGSPDAEAEFVLLSHGEKRICLQVDRVVGQRLVLQRPLDPFIGSLKLLSAAVSIDGDKLALVLNVPELFRLALRTDSPGGGGMVTSAVSGEPSPPRKAARRIMIVDDSEITRDTLVTIATRLGYETVEAINGQDGFEQLAKTQVDLVLTDLDMPVMDGFGLIAAIRRRGDLSKLPVVVLSTRRAAEDQQRARDAGANGYLVKALFKDAEFESVLAPFFAEQKT